MKNIEENNRLIAEFMGFTPDEYEMYLMEDFVVYEVTDTYDFDEENNNKGEVTIREGIVRTGFYPQEMEFNSNWNWIVPVIEKCRESQIFGSQRLIDNIDKRLMKLDLFATYGNVVDFIQFHNQFSTSTETA
jgi:hypothetical protein